MAILVDTGTLAEEFGRENRFVRNFAKTKSGKKAAGKVSKPTPKVNPKSQPKLMSEAELESTVGGAKNPNWKPREVKRSSFINNKLTDQKRFELMKANKNHIFSKDHLSNGIMELGNGIDEIMNNGLDIIDQLLVENKLKEGTTTIIGKLNGHVSSIRVFIKNGEVLSFNLFKGTSGRNGNIINLLH